MTALAIPKTLRVTATNEMLCRRVGVKLNGKDMGSSVVAYDVAAGRVELLNGDVMHGTVEPYWRRGKR